MLEVRRGIAVRSYENRFFREFAQNLVELFERYDLNGVLIGNPECKLVSHLQIDALLLTQHSVCIIDFKNFEGVINLPKHSEFESQTWTNADNQIIKGGSYINPYLQLSKQKKALTWLYHNSPLKRAKITFNPGHIKKVLCFHEPVTLNGHIPPKDEIDFFIAHKNSYLEIIKDIIDVFDDEINLNPAAFELFKELFVADPFFLTEPYSEHSADFLPDIKKKGYEENLDENNLLSEQKQALKEINTFLQQNQEQILILQGPTCSGKSYLREFIKTIAFRTGYPQVEYLASSYKVITNLVEEPQNFHSLYQYIYGGEVEEDEDSGDNEGHKDQHAKKAPAPPLSNEISPLKNIKIKECQDDKKCLYIIDEAQLISNRFSQSIEARWGTGRLLTDFITFLQLDQSQRKVIFIGDPYQITFGNRNESALSPDFFQTHYGFNPSLLKLPLSHKLYDGNPIIPDLIASIDTQCFNRLTFTQSEKLTLLNIKVSEDKQNLINLVGQQFNSSFRILSYKNEDCNNINLWIKKSFLKNGLELAINDLLLINNNINAVSSDSLPSHLTKVFNGDFAWVTEIGPTRSETISLKNDNKITLNFLRLTLKLCSSGQLITLYSLENYRQSIKGELSDDEQLALIILIKIKLQKLLKNSPFEQSTLIEKMHFSQEYQTLKASIDNLKQQLAKGKAVKTKLKNEENALKRLESEYKKHHRENITKQLAVDSNTEYFQYLNCAFLRYGWCMTVHKALSFKWNQILFDLNPHNNGITNLSYFNWLYSGLTRAKEKATLIKYIEITPFYRAKIIDRSQGTPQTLPYLILDNTLSIESVTPLLEQLNIADNHPFKSIIIQLYQFIKKMIAPLQILSVDHKNYQEIYQISNGKERAKLLFWYNKKGEIKYQLPTTVSDELKAQLLHQLLHHNGITDFENLNLDWRTTYYQQLNEKLNQIQCTIHWIKSTPYKDTRKIAKGADVAKLEFNYNNEGFFSTIEISSCSNQAIKETLLHLLSSQYSIDYP